LKQSRHKTQFLRTYVFKHYKAHKVGIERILDIIVQLVLQTSHGLPLSTKIQENKNGER